MLILASLIFTLSFSTLVIPQASLADSFAPTPGLPQVYIELVDQNKTAHVGPGDTGVVTFSGLVQVSMPPGTRVVVSLTAEDTWGSAVVSPSSILFDNDGEKPFSVSVRAPGNESCETIGIVRVFGRWSLYPGGLSGSADPVDGAVGRIHIAQFYSFSLSCSRTDFKTSSNEEVELELTIHNEGNGLDAFTIEVVNLNELNDEDFLVTLSESQVEIQKGQSRTIYIRVNTPSSGGTGDHDVTMYVSSDNGFPEGIAPKIMKYHIDHTSSLASSSSIMAIVIVILIILVILFLFWRWRKRQQDLLIEEQT